MTLARLEQKMLYQLQGFVPKPRREEIDPDTVHDAILDEDDGPPSSADLYKQFVVLSAKLEKTKLRRWPAEWMTLTIAELAPKLLPAKE
ncbi:MAG: hypothetical protein M3N43_12030 [Actinomycetota bacterium]|nr:hypothetical protein [Actinomycetota bacterium]